MENKLQTLKVECFTAQTSVQGDEPMRENREGFDGRADNEGFGEGELTPRNASA